MRRFDPGPRLQSSNCSDPSSFLFHQSPPAPSGPAYVTVAFNTAVLQTADAQHIFSDLQAKFAPRQTHLQQLNAQVEALRKQINNNAASLSDAEKSAEMHALDNEERLQREADDFKSDTDSASQQASSPSRRNFTSFCWTAQNNALTHLSLTAGLTPPRLPGSRSQRRYHC